jgi:hypothetical protein
MKQIKKNKWNVADQKTSFSLLLFVLFASSMLIGAGFSGYTKGTRDIQLSLSARNKTHVPGSESFLIGWEKCVADN